VPAPKLPQLVEVGGGPELFGRAPVVVRERVGDERAGAGGDGGQDEGVYHQGRPDHCGVGLVVGSALGQDAQQRVVQGDVPALVALGGPLTGDTIYLWQRGPRSQ
jgi:hypothetical protein